MRILRCVVCVPVRIMHDTRNAPKQNWPKELCRPVIPSRCVFARLSCFIIIIFCFSGYCFFAMPPTATVLFYFVCLCYSLSFSFHHCVRKFIVSSHNIQFQMHTHFFVVVVFVGFALYPPVPAAHTHRLLHFAERQTDRHAWLSLPCHRFRFVILLLVLFSVACQSIFLSFRLFVIIIRFIVCVCLVIVVIVAIFSSTSSSCCFFFAQSEPMHSYGMCMYVTVAILYHISNWLLIFHGVRPRTQSPQNRIHANNITLPVRCCSRLFEPMCCIICVLFFFFCLCFSSFDLFYRHFCHWLRGSSFCWFVYFYLPHARYLIIVSYSIIYTAFV